MSIIIPSFDISSEYDSNNIEQNLSQCYLKVGELYSLKELTVEMEHQNHIMLSQLEREDEMAFGRIFFYDKFSYKFSPIIDFYFDMEEDGRVKMIRPPDKVFLVTKIIPTKTTPNGHIKNGYNVQILCEETIGWFWTNKATMAMFKNITSSL